MQCQPRVVLKLLIWSSTSELVFIWLFVVNSQGNTMKYLKYFIQMEETICFILINPEFWPSNPPEKGGRMGVKLWRVYFAYLNFLNFFGGLRLVVEEEGFLEKLTLWPTSQQCWVCEFVLSLLFAAFTKCTWGSCLMDLERSSECITFYDSVNL